MESLGIKDLTKGLESLIHSAFHFNHVFFPSDPLRDFVVTLPYD